jgi:cyclopropane fatty-acyl-phospholipid synthase-like methyltransferase
VVWRLVRVPTPVSWVYGLRVFLDPATQISEAFFLTGRFEPNQMAVLDRWLQPGMTFIDVGANTGF